MRRRKESISGLLGHRPDHANVPGGGEVVEVDPKTVAIGDFIVVKPGEKVPLDGKVLTGESMLDTAALTGESVPRKVSATDDVLSGTINLNGVLTIEVTKTFGNSTVAKIIYLV